MLHNMLGFMKKTKHIRHNPASEGIYLSELNVDELEPEVAALYFPSSYNKQNHSQTTNPGRLNMFVHVVCYFKSFGFVPYKFVK